MCAGFFRRFDKRCSDNRRFDGMRWIRPLLRWYALDYSVALMMCAGFFHRFDNRRSDNRRSDSVRWIRPLLR